MSSGTCSKMSLQADMSSAVAVRRSARVGTTVALKRGGGAADETWLGPGEFLKSGAVKSRMQVDRSNGNIIDADETTPFRILTPWGNGEGTKRTMSLWALLSLEATSNLHKTIIETLGFSLG